MDDYVVEKALIDRDVDRQTTKDFKAKTVEWMPSGNGLAILGMNGHSGSEARFSPNSQGLYRTTPGEGSLKVSRIATEVQAMVAGPPGAQWMLLAIEDGSSKSRLALMEAGGTVRPYAAEVEGKVTGLSVSPAGDQAILAARNPVSGRYGIYTFSLPEENFKLVEQLEGGQEVFGDPQWTKQGIYYIAGEQQEAGKPDAAPFDLYRVPPGSSTSEPAPRVGGDFVALNSKRDPEGSRLAVIGRRNPSSSENLYILDLDSESLEAATSNEDMQIKTGAEDLAWSDDGSSVVIVARAILSEPKVYSAPADTLVTDFYNLYEVPTDEIARGD